MYDLHALSDFAVSSINPLYAYDADMTYNGENIMNGLYEEGSLAVHDWNADQQNYGTLPANHPYGIVADIENGTGQADGQTRGAGKQKPRGSPETPGPGGRHHPEKHIGHPGKIRREAEGLQPAECAGQRIRDRDRTGGKGRHKRERRGKAETDDASLP